LSKKRKNNVLQTIFCFVIGEIKESYKRIAHPPPLLEEEGGGKRIRSPAVVSVVDAKMFKILNKGFMV
jgi:hypothetical protein